MKLDQALQHLIYGHGSWALVEKIWLDVSQCVRQHGVRGRGKAGLIVMTTEPNPIVPNPSLLLHTGLTCGRVPGGPGLGGGGGIRAAPSARAKASARCNDLRHHR